MKKDLLYIDSIGDLFTDTQESDFLNDQKSFVDAVPKSTITDIITAYAVKKNDADFSLKAFVEQNFNLPTTTNNTFKTDSENSIENHIKNLWDVLSRQPGQNGGTLIALPYRFVVPGGRFREIYYWDSYFTMLGLQASNRMDLVEDMVKNFAWLINEFGHIPNGNRTYFLSRSQPPFFSHMVMLLAVQNEQNILTQYLPALAQEYNFWMKGSSDLLADNNAIEHSVLMPSGAILNRYWDTENTPRPEGYLIDKEIAATTKLNQQMYRNIRAACESGWDFTSRWFATAGDFTTIQTIDIIPVDLNCLLYHLEKTMAAAWLIKGDEKLASFYLKKSQVRCAAIHIYLWNDAQQMFMDYNFKTNKSTPAISMAMAYPLFVEIATPIQATKTLEHIENFFLHPGGLVSTTFKNKEQWDAPNGWAPLQWIGYMAAINYKNIFLANTIKNNWTKNVARVFNETGKIMEKYNVVDITTKAGGGEYENQDGFGWTNGVYIKLMS